MYMHAAKVKGGPWQVLAKCFSQVHGECSAAFCNPIRGAEQFSQAVNVSSNTLQMHSDRKTLCSTELSSNVRVAVQEQGNEKTFEQKLQRPTGL